MEAQAVAQRRRKLAFFWPERWLTPGNTRRLDTVFLVVLPVLFLFFLSLDEPVRSLACTLTVAIFLYEILIYERAEIYGLSGLRILSFPAVAYVSFTAMLAIPSVWVVLNEPSRAADTFFYAVNSFYLLFPLGLLFANYFFRIDLDQVGRLGRQNLVRPVSSQRVYVFLIILLVVCLAIMGRHISRMESVPLIELILNPGEKVKLAWLRLESINLLDIPAVEIYLYSWARTALYGVGVIASLFMAVITRERRFRVLFVVFLVFGLFNNSLTIAKAHTAALVLALALFFFLKNRGRISTRLMAVSMAAVFAFPYIVIKFTAGVPFTFSRVLYLLWLRTFYVPAWVLKKYFEIFPTYHSFLGGRTSHLYSWLHPEGHFPVANWLFQTLDVSTVTAGLASANYMSFFWADFGWVGIIVSSLLVGMVTHYIYWVLLRTCHYLKDVIYVTTVTVLAMSFSFYFAGANFPILIISHGIILFVLAFWMITSFRTRYEKPKSGVV
ncbi:MAG: hypothetical protein ACE5HZ_03125 [Fidelibacterota bacterium]